VYNDPEKPPFPEESFKMVVGRGGFIHFGAWEERGEKHGVRIKLANLPEGHFVSVGKLCDGNKWLLVIQTNAPALYPPTIYYEFSPRGTLVQCKDLLLSCPVVLSQPVDGRAPAVAAGELPDLPRATPAEEVLPSPSEEVADTTTPAKAVTAPALVQEPSPSRAAPPVAKRPVDQKSSEAKQVTHFAKENVYDNPEKPPFDGESFEMVVGKGGFIHFGSWKEERELHRLRIRLRILQEGSSVRIGKSFMDNPLPGPRPQWLIWIETPGHQKTFCRFTDSGLHLEQIELTPQARVTAFARQGVYNDPKKPPFDEESFKMVVGKGGYIYFGNWREERKQHQVRIELYILPKGHFVSVGKLWDDNKWLLVIQTNAPVLYPPTIYYEFSPRGTLMQCKDLPLSCPLSCHVIEAKTGRIIEAQISPLNASDIESASGRLKYYLRSGDENENLVKLVVKGSIGGILYWQMGEGCPYDINAQTGLSLKDFNPKQALYVGSIEVSQENRYGSSDRKYKGIGTALMAWLVAKSIDLGFGGKVYLISRSDTKEFYQGLGMTLVDDENLHRDCWFYFTEEKARQFLADYRTLEAVAAFNNFFNPIESGFIATQDNCTVVRNFTGHVNTTYELRNKTTGRVYIVQGLNTIFDISAIDNNLQLLEEAQEAIKPLLPKYWKKARYLDVKGTHGKVYYNEAGSAWRVMEFIPGQIFSAFKSVPENDRADAARSLGEAIAIFGKILNAAQGEWKKPLPEFHNAGYHRQYLEDVLSGKEVKLSLSQDEGRRVRLSSHMMSEYSERIQRLLGEVRKREDLVTCLEGLGQAVTHGDLKINNAIFARGDDGKLQCIALIDLDTLQIGNSLDDLGDALRSAGNPAAEEPKDINEVKIDIAIVENIISGYLKKIEEFYNKEEVDKVRKYAIKAFKQFLYVQCLRFFADALVGNEYWKLKPEENQPEDLNLYRAEVQMRALQELEKCESLLEQKISAASPAAAAALPLYTEPTLQALEETKGSRKEAAKKLNISPHTLWIRLKTIRKIAIETNNTAMLERLERALCKSSQVLPSYTEETLKALEETKGNRKEAARILGISYGALWKRLKTIREIATQTNNTAMLERLERALCKSSQTLPPYTQETLEALEGTAASSEMRAAASSPAAAPAKKSTLTAQILLEAAKKQEERGNYPAALRFSQAAEAIQEALKMYNRIEVPIRRVLGLALPGLRAPPVTDFLNTPIAYIEDNRIKKHPAYKYILSPSVRKLIREHEKLHLAHPQIEDEMQICALQAQQKNNPDPISDPVSIDMHQDKEKIANWLALIAAAIFGFGPIIIKHLYTKIPLDSWPAVIKTTSIYFLLVYVTILILSCLKGVQHFTILKLWTGVPGRTRIYLLSIGIANAISGWFFFAMLSTLDALTGSILMSLAIVLNFILSHFIASEDISFGSEKGKQKWRGFFFVIAGVTMVGMYSYFSQVKAGVFKWAAAASIGFAVVSSLFGAWREVSVKRVQNDYKKAHSGDEMDLGLPLAVARASYLFGGIFTLATVLVGGFVWPEMGLCAADANILHWFLLVVGLSYSFAYSFRYTALSYKFEASQMVLIDRLNSIFTALYMFILYKLLGVGTCPSWIQIPAAILIIFGSYKVVKVSVQENKPAPASDAGAAPDADSASRTEPPQTITIAIYRQAAQRYEAAGNHTVAKIFRDAAQDIENAFRQWYSEMHGANAPPFDVNDFLYTPIAEVEGKNGIQIHGAFFSLNNPGFICQHEELHISHPELDEMQICDMQLRSAAVANVNLNLAHVENLFGKEKVDKFYRDLKGIIEKAKEFENKQRYTILIRRPLALLKFLFILLPFNFLKAWRMFWNAEEIKDWTFEPNPFRKGAVHNLAIKIDEFSKNYSSGVFDLSFAPTEDIVWGDVYLGFGLQFVTADSLKLLRRFGIDEDLLKITPTQERINLGYDCVSRKTLVDNQDVHYLQIRLRNGDLHDELLNKNSPYFAFVACWALSHKQFSSSTADNSPDRFSATLGPAGSSDVSVPKGRNSGSTSIIYLAAIVGIVLASVIGLTLYANHAACASVPPILSLGTVPLDSLVSALAGTVPGAVAGTVPSVLAHPASAPPIVTFGLGLPLFLGGISTQISEENILQIFKQGRLPRNAWSEMSPKAKLCLVQELARVSKKKPEELTTADFLKKRPEFGNKSLGGLLDWAIRTFRCPGHGFPSPADNLAELKRRLGINTYGKDKSSRESAVRTGLDLDWEEAKREAAQARTLGERIKILREDGKGWSKAELAWRADLGSHWVYMIENNKTGKHRESTLQNLINAFAEGDTNEAEEILNLLCKDLVIQLEERKTAIRTWPDEIFNSHFNFYLSWLDIPEGYRLLALDRLLELITESSGEESEDNFKRYWGQFSKLVESYGEEIRGLIHKIDIRTLERFRNCLSEKEGTITLLQDLGLTGVEEVAAPASPQADSKSKKSKTDRRRQVRELISEAEGLYKKGLSRSKKKKPSLNELSECRRQAWHAELLFENAMDLLPRGQKKLKKNLQKKAEAAEKLGIRLCGPIEEKEAHLKKTGADLIKAKLSGGKRETSGSAKEATAAPDAKSHRPDKGRRAFVFVEFLALIAIFAGVLAALGSPHLASHSLLPILGLPVLLMAGMRGQKDEPVRRGAAEIKGDEDLEIPTTEPKDFRDKHQTRFFRHCFGKIEETAFTIFIKELAERAKGRKSIRILSAGCSTGEEAYTIAIALLEKGVNPQNIHIMGIDCDRRCVSDAKKAEYNLAAIEKVPQHILEKYFVKTDSGNYRVCPEVKKLVKFQMADLTNRNNVARLGKFTGIVFMRTGHLLSGEERIKAYRNLAAVSLPEGMLFTSCNNNRRLIFARDPTAGAGFKVHALELELEKQTFGWRNLNRLNSREFSLSEETYAFEYCPQQADEWAVVNVKSKKDGSSAAKFYTFTSGDTIDIAWEIIDKNILSQEKEFVSAVWKRFQQIKPRNFLLTHSFTAFGPSISGIEVVSQGDAPAANNSGFTSVEFLALIAICAGVLAALGSLHLASHSLLPILLCLAAIGAATVAGQNGFRPKIGKINGRACGDVCLVLLGSVYRKVYIQMSELFKRDPLRNIQDFYPKELIIFSNIYKNTLAHFKRFFYFTSLKPNIKRIGIFIKRNLHLYLLGPVSSYYNYFAVFFSVNYFQNLASKFLVRYCALSERFRDFIRMQDRPFNFSLRNIPFFNPLQRVFGIDKFMHPRTDNTMRVFSSQLLFAGAGIILVLGTVPVAVAGTVPSASAPLGLVGFGILLFAGVGKIGPPPIKRKWTREKIIELLQRPPSEVKDPRSCTQWENAGQGRVVRAAYDLFGKWSTAVKKAGLEPKNWTRKRILSHLRKPPSKINNPSNSGEWQRAGCGRMIDVAGEIFGGWHAAVRKAGLKPFRRDYGPWTKRQEKTVKKDDRNLRKPSAKPQSRISPSLKQKILERLKQVSISRRNREIFLLRVLKGQTLREIAKKYSLTRARVSQIVKDVEFKLGIIFPWEVTIEKVKRKGVVLGPEREETIKQCTLNLNAGVLALKGRRFLFVRRALPEEPVPEVRKSRIGLFIHDPEAKKSEGKIIIIDSRMLEPNDKQLAPDKNVVALEDPRVIERDGTIYVFLTVVVKRGEDISYYSALTMHSTKEFLKIVRRKLKHPEDQIHWNWSPLKRLITNRYGRHKNFVPFGNPLDGKWYALYRPTAKERTMIRLAVSESGLAGPWEDAGLYMSIPPEEGWHGPSAFVSGAPSRIPFEFMLYHRAIEDEKNRFSYYDLRLIAVDRNNPRNKFVTGPLLVPKITEPFEKEGWKPGTIYSCGAILTEYDKKKGRYVFDIYYSGSDTAVLWATVTIRIKKKKSKQRASQQEG
jgi:predicted GH43/DUF377 family glycosyl hydrolase/uncharacterized membrane protein